MGAPRMMRAHGAGGRGGQARPATELDTQGGRGSRPTTRFPRAWAQQTSRRPQWRPRPRHGGGCERVSEVPVRCATRVCYRERAHGPRAGPRVSGAAGGRAARQPRRGGFWGFLHRGAPRCRAEGSQAWPTPPPMRGDARQGRLRTRAERPRAPRGTGGPQAAWAPHTGPASQWDTGSKESKVPKCPEAKRPAAVQLPDPPHRAAASRTGEDRTPHERDPRRLAASAPSRLGEATTRGRGPLTAGLLSTMGPCRKQGLGVIGPEFLCAACMGTEW